MKLLQRGSEPGGDVTKLIPSPVPWIRDSASKMKKIDTLNILLAGRMVTVNFMCVN